MAAMNAGPNLGDVAHALRDEQVARAAGVAEVLDELVAVGDVKPTSATVPAASTWDETVLPECQGWASRP